MKHFYGMRLRGFSPGCQPTKGFVERLDDNTGKYHDILVYDRKLTAKEQVDYELDELDPTAVRLKGYQDRTDYLAEYHKKNIKQFKVAINRKTEADMMAYLEALPNIQGYIKGLVTADMARKTYYVTSINGYDENVMLKTSDLGEARKFARSVIDRHKEYTKDILEIRLYDEDIEDEDCTCFDYNTIDY